MNDLTEQQKRVKIAEALGWKRLPIPEKLNWGAIAGAPNWYFTHELPDFFSDLNACREFEETLSDRERLQYVEEIGKLVRQEAADSGLNPRAMEDRDVIFRHMHATAAQRCEAFGKTKGLW